MSLNSLLDPMVLPFNSTFFITACMLHGMVGDNVIPYWDMIPPDFSNFIVFATISPPAPSITASKNGLLFGNIPSNCLSQSLSRYDTPPLAPIFTAFSILTLSPLGSPSGQTYKRQRGAFHGRQVLGSELDIVLMADHVLLRRAGIVHGCGAYHGILLDVLWAIGVGFPTAGGEKKNVFALEVARALRAGLDDSALTICE
ncbi:hypothetical protein VP1G_11440 [Cytospora mali]|uniref:Uncharacterized protein n=1 Tax=Cytospora mali TaxID=578113 RepID=A0A194VGG0_CYTMA|nr:hypothetical protein VP1G_11440 [Valsa mali var. pyri (nom. inval.)]